MSYIETFETELMQKLETGTESTGTLVRWVSTMPGKCTRGATSQFDD
jgi:hypothetical protein